MTKHKYVGLDVHQATTSIAVLDSNGKLLSQSTIQTSSQEICNFIPHQVYFDSRVSNSKDDSDCAFPSPPRITVGQSDCRTAFNQRAGSCRHASPFVLLDSHCLTCLSSDLDHFWRDCKPDSKPI